MYIELPVPRVGTDWKSGDRCTAQRRAELRKSDARCRVKQCPVFTSVLDKDQGTGHRRTRDPFALHRGRRKATVDRTGHIT